jgi:hypothetical protein
MKKEKLTIDVIVDVKKIMMENGLDDETSTSIISDIINLDRSRALMAYYSELNSKKINKAEFYKKILTETVV